MGAVYSCEQMSLKRRVAVKLLRPELGTNQMILRRFNAEAEMVAKLKHPNTVAIYDFGQDADGSLFIAMEFIEGRSLRAALQQEGPFSPARALAIAVQVAASLSDAHSNELVHRDLKPDNVMLQDRGKQKDIARVLDFGIAKLRDENRSTQAMTQAGDMLGTPQYMAPEQIKGEAIDGRTDVYALGCMIYEMVTGRLAFEATSIMAMLSKHLMEDVVPPTRRRPELALPPAVDQLVLSAMAKSPAMRPTTMEQYSEMISAVLAMLPSDPNRSSGLSLQQGVVGVSGPGSAHGIGPAVTPAAYSAVGASLSPPSFGAPRLPGPPEQIPYGAPSYGAPSPMPAPPYSGGASFTPSAALPRLGEGPGPAAYLPAHAGPTINSPQAKSRAPLYAILAVVVLGGIAVAVWAVTRETSATIPASSDPWGPTPSAPQTPTQTPSRALDPDPDPPDPDDTPTPANDPWNGDGT